MYITLKVKRNVVNVKKLNLLMSSTNIQQQRMGSLVDVKNALSNTILKVKIKKELVKYVNLTMMRKTDTLLEENVGDATIKNGMTRI